MRNVSVWCVHTKTEKANLIFWMKLLPERGIYFLSKWESSLKTMGVTDTFIISLIQQKQVFDYFSLRQLIYDKLHAVQTPLLIVCVRLKLSHCSLLPHYLKACCAFPYFFPTFFLFSSVEHFSVCVPILSLNSGLNRKAGGAG